MPSLGIHLASLDPESSVAGQRLDFPISLSLFHRSSLRPTFVLVLPDQRSRSLFAVYCNALLINTVGRLASPLGTHSPPCRQYSKHFGFLYSVAYIRTSFSQQTLSPKEGQADAGGRRQNQHDRGMTALLWALVLLRPNANPIFGRPMVTRANLARHLVGSSGSGIALALFHLVTQLRLVSISKQLYNRALRPRIYAHATTQSRRTRVKDEVIR